MLFNLRLQGPFQLNLGASRVYNGCKNHHLFSLIFFFNIYKFINLFLNRHLFNNQFTGTIPTELGNLITADEL